MQLFINKSKGMAKEIKLDKSYEEIKSIVETSETYSEAARRLFGDDSYSKREKVKRLIEEYGLVFEHKSEKKRYCLFCGKEITGKNRGIKKFCSHSCSASYNNRGVTRNGVHQETKYCLYCGKELKNKRSKFCSCECQKNYEYEERVKKWKNGEEPGWSGHGAGIKPFLKRYMFEKNDFHCQRCGWGEKNPITGTIPLQIHHIDGDCKNNSEENLELLCPNCHSLTDTFGKLNKKSSRKR